MTNFKALNQAVPTRDYSSALQGALSWLGDRYLCAEPVNRRADSRVARIETHASQPSVKTVQWVQYR
jgi:hypothetical protein